jgi:hypothetical protein
MANESQQKMVDSFVKDLETYLGVSHTRLSLRDEWKRTGPLPHRSKTLEEYMQYVSGLGFALLDSTTNIVVCLLA